MSRIAGAVLPTALLAFACGGASPPASSPGEPAAATDAGADTTASFARLEDRLARAEYVEVTARLTAEGLVRAELEGTLLIEGDRVLLGFEGAFQNEPVELSLTSDGAVMSGGNGRLSFSHEAPPALQEGLAIGLTRMGLLHNLAVLSSGNPPHGTYGGVRDWVTIRELAPVDDHLELQIDVDGKPAASAKLWLDPATGLPARREQTVRFDAGEMRVVEVYEAFTARGRSARP